MARQNFPKIISDSLDKLTVCSPAKEHCPAIVIGYSSVGLFYWPNLLVIGLRRQETRNLPIDSWKTRPTLFAVKNISFCFSPKTPALRCRLKLTTQVGPAILGLKTVLENHAKREIFKSSGSMTPSFAGDVPVDTSL